MISMTAARTAVERRAVAEFVTGKSFQRALVTKPSPQTMCSATTASVANVLVGPAWNGWSATASNSRFQDAATAGFTAAAVPRLKLKWAFGFPGDIAADAQPTVAGGRVFVGSQSGNVYALSAATGCVHWFFQAAASVRAAITIGRIDVNGRPREAAFSPDGVHAYVTAEIGGIVNVIDVAASQVIGTVKIECLFGDGMRVLQVEQPIRPASEAGTR